MLSIFLACIFFSASLFAQEPSSEIDALMSSLNHASQQRLRENPFYLESVRQMNLARLSIISGNYEASMSYSEEAIRQAELSDRYIENRLRQLSLTQKMNNAKEAVLWAENSKVKEYYPEQTALAREHLDMALALEAEGADENYNRITELSLLVLADLADTAIPDLPAPKPGATTLSRADFPNQPQNPNEYLVRPWDIYGDCLWNIAAWFYGNPRQWRILFEENKSRLPDPANPDLIEVGTILIIPPLNGEQRSGIWDTGKRFER
jgi:hypothetical protein